MKTKKAPGVANAPEKGKTQGVAAVAGGLGQAERKTAFIRQLADFLAGNQAAKGIALQMDMMRPAGDRRPLLAKEWAELRGKSPLMGYPTVDEAVEQLTRFLA